MDNFTYENPTKIIFGKGVLDRLGETLVQLKPKKVLFVYGGGSIKQNRVYNQIMASLKTTSIIIVEHPGVSGNPTLDQVETGVHLAKKENIDLVLGAGGGSVIDASKAIALGAVSDIPVWDYFTKKATPQKALPVVAVSTLPATASEMNGISVVTHEGTHEKNAIVCPGVLNPKVALMDPETTFSLSPKQTAYACTDILSHLMEAYLTTDVSHLILQDKLVEAVASSTIDATKRILQHPNDYDARAAFMWSATLAWNGLCQAGTPNWSMPSHGLEMPLSAVYNMPHGAGLSIIIPAWMREFGDHHRERILLFGKQILKGTPTTVDQVADALTQFYIDIGSPVTCAQANVPNPDIEKLTKLAFASLQNRGLTHYTTEMIRAIYSRTVD